MRKDRCVRMKSMPIEEGKRRAFELTERLRGLMKDEIAAHGGTVSFLRWIRSDRNVTQAEPYTRKTSGSSRCSR
jgi:hypothetical protein